MNQQNDRSPHILNTSSNLLGLCFIVLTSLNVLKLKGATFIDEITACATVLFMGASFLSFLSMRSANGRGQKFEKKADIMFLLGLLMLFVTAMLIAFNLIR